MLNRSIISGQRNFYEQNVGKISDDYGWEVTVFHKLRDTSDGVVFFDGKINWDRYLADHSPRFEVHLILFNYTIIELTFTIYTTEMKKEHNFRNPEQGKCHQTLDQLNINPDQGRGDYSKNRDSWQDGYTVDSLVDEINKWKQWDRQIEQDSASGKLKAITDRALADHVAGQTEPL